jgi:hypothetical protein
VLCNSRAGGGDGWGAQVWGVSATPVCVLTSGSMLMRAVVVDMCLSHRSCMCNCA